MKASAFVVGSHAYGTPRKDSDIDLVIHIDASTLPKGVMAKLQSMNESSCEFSDLDIDCKPTEDRGGQIVLREGGLHILIMFDEAKFKVWKRCAEVMTILQPQSKDQAHEYIRRSFRNLGTTRERG